LLVLGNGRSTTSESDIQEIEMTTSLAVRVSTVRTFAAATVERPSLMAAWALAALVALLLSPPIGAQVSPAARG
jgi:hypothetical protein